MADFVFNISKGEVKAYAKLPAASDALILIPIESSGIEADETLKDYDDISALLAGSSNEQTTFGRKTITSVTITVDDTGGNNKVTIDTADQVWATSAGNAIGALVFAYDGDTGAGTDANLTPLTKHDWAITPDGSDVTATIANFFQAT